MKIKHRPLHVLALSVLCLAALVPASVPEAQIESAEDEAVMKRIARGRVSFRLYCRSCHGDQGKGDGSVADLLKIPPADLTMISSRRGGDFPVDEVHRIIDGRQGVRGHGASDMPIWGDAFTVVAETKDEAVIAEKITQLVYFLRSIQEEAGTAAE